MYVQYCASCHGDAGKGDGPGGANLAVKPQDLSVGAVMNPLPDEFLHGSSPTGRSRSGSRR